MREAPYKRSGDGAPIGLPAETPGVLWEDGKNGGAYSTKAPVQEDAGCALHGASVSLLEAGGQAPSLPMTPPPEARTDWPRGIGELGTEGMDPSQPLNELPNRPGLLSPD